MHRSRALGRRSHQAQGAARASDLFKDGDGLFRGGKRKLLHILVFAGIVHSVLLVECLPFGTAHTCGASCIASFRSPAYDPEGMEQAAKLLDDVTYCDSAYEAFDGAHAAVIVTEWDAFRALDFARMKGLLAENLLVDLRNLYNREDVERQGFRYVAVGMGVVREIQREGVRRR